jgi:LytS/YehU family sensor histidine kinase
LRPSDSIISSIFKISISPDLDVSAFQIPPLIIQPYAENAIWHGLHKEEGKAGRGVKSGRKRSSPAIADDGVGGKLTIAIQVNRRR